MVLNVLGKARRFQHWVGEALAHAIGNPTEEQKSQPPEVGVQPYRDMPHEHFHS